ncbi:hypothetical protein STEG23_009231 [Scotinomys teguina]
MGLRIIMRRKICQTRKTNAMCTIHSLAFHGFRSSSYDPINLTRTICVVIGLRLPIRAWAVDELFLCRLSAASKVTGDFEEEDQEKNKQAPLDSTGFDPLSLKTCEGSG